MTGMPDHINGNLAAHFGYMMRKERLAKGWTLRELSARTDINFSHLGRIENGKRPPTEAIAITLDERAFPGRATSFLEFYLASRDWMPPGFRDWAEYEDKATVMRVWHPTTVHGLLQTEDYARVTISVYPGVDSDIIAGRLRARMARQQRVLLRQENPPDTHVVVDETALYRRVGSPAIMAEQCARLLELAALDHVRLQVAPAVENPCAGSEMIHTGNAVYAESLAGGGTHTNPDVVERLGRLFATLVGECYRVSESRRMIERMRATWTELGASLPTQAVTGAAASKPPATTA